MKGLTCQCALQLPLRIGTEELICSDGNLHKTHCIFSKFHARFCGPTSEPVFRAGFLIPLIIAGLEVRPFSGRVFKPAFNYFLQFFCIFRCAFVPVFGQVWHGSVAVGNGLVLGVYRCGAEHSSRLKDQAENTTNGLTRIGPKRRPSSTMRLRGLAPQMVTAIRVHGLVRKLSSVYV